MTRLPRVLTLTNMYPVAHQPALGSFVASQVQSLRTLGLETDVLFVDGVSSRVNYLRGIRDLNKAIRSKKYDLIHAHYGLTGIVGRFQNTLPLVVSFCGDDLLGTPRRPLLPIRADRRYPRTPLSLAIVGVSHALEGVASAIIVKSEEMRRRLLLASSRRRAYVIPNGVDMSSMRVMDRTEAREALDLHPTRRYVLFPHTAYVLRKRLDLAEAAIRLLKQRRDDVELLVVYHQPPEKMPLFYAAANAMLLTSEWEGSPNVVKEALACELPVVSVETGDVQERLAGLHECAVCARDPESLANAIARIVDLPRPTTLRSAVADLDLASVADRVVSVYRDVLDRRAR